MTLIELRDLCNKRLAQHCNPNTELFIDGEKMDNVVDLWNCANGKIGIVGNSTIEAFAKMEEDEY
jgi:hypothetical protein